MLKEHGVVDSLTHFLVMQVGITLSNGDTQCMWSANNLNLLCPNYKVVDCSKGQVSGIECITTWSPPESATPPHPFPVTATPVIVLL